MRLQYVKVPFRDYRYWYIFHIENKGEKGWQKSNTVNKTHSKSICFLRQNGECDWRHFDGLSVNAPIIIDLTKAFNNTCNFRFPLWRFIGKQLSFRPEENTDKRVEPAHSPSESSADTEETGSSKCVCCVQGATCKHGQTLKVSSTVCCSYLELKLIVWCSLSWQWSYLHDSCLGSAQITRFGKGALCPFSYLQLKVKENRLVLVSASSLRLVVQGLPWKSFLRESVLCQSAECEGPVNWHSAVNYNPVVRTQCKQVITSISLSRVTPK